MSYDTLGRKINMTDPDLGYWLFTYDPSGNLLTQTDAKGQIITFTYDELNRVNQKTYSTSEPTVIYTYDNTAIPNGIGRLFSVKTDTSASVKAYTTQYEYDCSGKMTAVAYPDTYELTYTYHPGSSLINTVIGSDSYTYAVYSVYEPTGKVGRIDHGNGTATAYTYDALSTRLTGITTSDSSGLSENDIQRRAYLYSQGGDITAIVDDLRNITYNYTYDSLHRLISETNTGQYDAVSYTYDAIGNITSRTVGSTYFNYTAYDPSHKHAVKTINVNNVNYDFTYDDNGNMTGGPAITKSGYATMRAITYNTDNMPTQIQHGSTTVTVAYDPTGKRTKKSVYSGSTTYYVNQYFEEKNGGGIKYIFAGNLRIAKVSSSSMYFFHKDHLGSSVGMSNASGTKAESTDYMPFGEERDHSGSTVTDYKFTDQELDSESGLYNYDARLYDPGIGRFICADSIVPDMYDPQSLNRYAYCYNNPLRYNDPTGHTVIGIGIGAVTGCISGAIAGIRGSSGLASAITGGIIGGTIGAVIGGLVGVVAPTSSSLVASTTVGAISGSLGGMVGGITARGTIAAFDAKEKDADPVDSAFDAAFDYSAMTADGIVGLFAGGMGGIAGFAGGVGWMGEVSGGIVTSSIGRAGDLLAGVVISTCNRAGDSQSSVDTDNDGIGSDGSGSGGGFDGTPGLGL